MVEYSDAVKTNVSWLHQIPAHWELKKIDALFSERKTKVSDKDFAPLSVTKKGILPQLEHAAKSNDSDNRKLVKAGDFVINSRSDRKGSCGVSPYDGSVSLINIVLTPRSGLNSQFVHYLLRNYRFSEEYYRNGRGIVADLWTTRYSEMRTILLPVPPRAEQDQIVRFLDWKVSEINKLIGIRRKEIEFLNEYREIKLAKLTHYGLDESATFVDSGYSWIGTVPTGWHVRTFSKVASVKSNLVSPDQYMNNMQISPASIEKNTGRIVQTQTVKEAGIISGNHRFFAGQILYSKVRPLLNKVTIAPFDGLCSADMYPIETVLNTKYLMYFMLSQNFLDQLSMSGNRVKMPKINQDELSGVLILFPDEDEQERIVNKLDCLFSVVDKQIQRLKEHILLLQELKSVIISDAVTGKIDVRDVSIPEYEQVDDVADEDSEGNNDEEDTETEMDEEV